MVVNLRVFGDVMADLKWGDLRRLLLNQCGRNSSRCQISRGEAFALLDDCAVGGYCNDGVER
jgi:hypothetical protein